MLNNTPPERQTLTALYAQKKDPSLTSTESWEKYSFLHDSFIELLSYEFSEKHHGICQTSMLHYE